MHKKCQAWTIKQNNNTSSSTRGKTLLTTTKEAKTDPLKLRPVQRPTTHTQQENDRTTTKQKHSKTEQQEHYLAKQSPDPTPTRTINTEKSLSNPHSTSTRGL
jgi:hypothetical protein